MFEFGTDGSQLSTINHQLFRMIALIDYGSGNIRSVINALRHERADVELISDPARLAEADAVVLPGVGAFGDCVRGLQTRGLWEPLEAWLAADKPFLGICVGYQMLFESSEESPGVRGFGFFGGRRAESPADRLEPTRTDAAESSALARPSRAAARLFRPLVFSGTGRRIDRHLAHDVRRDLRRQRRARPRGSRAISPRKKPGRRPRHPAQFHREHAGERVK